MRSDCGWEYYSQIPQNILLCSWIATEEVGEEVGFPTNMFHDYAVWPELLDHALDARVLYIGTCHIPVCT